MNTERAQVGWRFWLGWVVASTVGLGVGMAVPLWAIVVFHGVLAYAAGGRSSALGEAVALYVFLTLIGAFGGASVGIAQWLVLRRQVARAGWWVLASIVGFALGFVVGGPLGSATTSRAVFTPVDVAVQFLLGGAGNGAPMGIAQWLVLRRQVGRAGWWVLASTVGLAVGAFFSVAAGVIYAPITGGVLVWLLRQPVTKEQSPPLAAE